MLTRINITEVLSPVFEGISFGEVGPYRLLRGTASGELDPGHPGNRGIVNLDKAPRNAAGLVEYTVELEILQPVEPARGNGVLLYDVLNRGDKRVTTPRANGGPLTNSPRSAADAGTGCFMRRGYTMVWSGWQADVPPGEGRMRGIFPVAREDGAPLAGRTCEEIIDETGTNPIAAKLTYPAADVEAGAATLTVRQREADPRQTPPGMDWRYLEEGTIEITRPEGFDAGAIYEFIYEAKEPTVMGIAFASVRDVVSFLRYEEADAGSNANPLAVDGRLLTERALAIGFSQSGRFLREFIYQGFNGDEQERLVFEGIMAIIAGSRLTNINMPFSVPGQHPRQHEDHTMRGDQFPFSYPTRTDPLTSASDGILAGCNGTAACPRIMHVDTDSEAWQAHASLVVHDAAGPVEQPENVRVYWIPGSQHQPEKHDTSGFAQHPGNPQQYGSIIRALLVALDSWCAEGTPPPESLHGTVAQGTLIPPKEAAEIFNTIPGVECTGLINELRVLDHSTLPPREGAAYPMFVNAPDADGNGRAGIRHPLLRAPVATHTGWNLRKAGHAEGELADNFGMYLPFARTRAEREAAGDPRLSLEERYGTQKGYLDAVAAACREMVAERLLLPEDVAAILKEAAAQKLGLPEGQAQILRD